MAGRSPSVIWLTLGVGLAVIPALAAQQGSPSEPPMPYEDVGACPFECCVYREWTANAKVTLLRERRPGSEVAFIANKGDRVQAFTGVVVTLRPGRMRFGKAVDLWTSSGPLHIEPGETLYLLTYHGEGFTTGWFKGRLHDDVDASEFWSAPCHNMPSACDLTTLERPRSEWWVRVRSLEGITGWTREPEKFDNKDACGA